MHQLINSDFSGLGKILPTAESKLAPPFRGVGKRSCITLTFNPIGSNLPLGIEFYAENVVSPTPSDPDFGFTLEDLTVFRGVAIYLIDGETRTSGEIISFGEFLDRYISDDVTRTPIEICMNRLEQEAAIKQGFVDKINNLWQERDVTRKTLYDKKVH